MAFSALPQANTRQLINAIALLCTLCIPVSLQADDTVTEADIKALRTEIDSLQSQITDFKGQHASTQRALRYSETQIGKLNQQIAGIEGQVKRQQKRLTSMLKRRGELVVEGQYQKQRIEQQIRIAYQMGREKGIKLLLNQENPTTINRHLTYLDYFNKARAQLLNEYAQTTTKLDSLLPQIEQETSDLTTARQKLEFKKKDLYGEQSKRKQALAAIKSALTNKDQQLANRREEYKRLEKLLVAVENAVANLKLPNDYRDFAERRGAMSWPAKATVKNMFGRKRNNAGIRWQGSLLEGREGTPIRAIHNGRVVFAEWFRGQGLLIIVDHGDGFMSLYGHNQSLLRETGEWVRAGEPIATLGSSGGRENPGLYFEIRQNGKPVNPAKWCKKS